MDLLFRDVLLRKLMEREEEKEGRIIFYLTSKFYFKKLRKINEEKSLYSFFLGNKKVNLFIFFSFKLKSTFQELDI